VLTAPVDEMTRSPHVVHLFTAGQSIVLLHDDLADLVARGAMVSVISGASTSPANLSMPDGIVHHTIPQLSRRVAPSGDLGALVEIHRLLRHLQPDVLHTHTPKAGLLGRIAGRTARVPVVVNTCRGLPVSERPSRPHELAFLALEASAGLLSDREFYLSEGDEHLVGWCHPHRNVIVGSGIDLDRFGFDPEARRAVRAELGLAPDALVVGGVGRRVADKGLREFATAAAALRDRATFVWIGPDDPEKADAISEDLASVRFLGNRSAIERIYSALDVFALPTHREGFSRSGMEAAATGLPIVTTQIRGTAGLGRDGVELLRVPVGDELALTDAIRSLLDDPELRRSIGANARVRALGFYDAQRVAAIYVAHYNAVSHRRRLGWQVGEATHAAA
jgi:glycosyltransferase involved in cell wall biosynthesis